jgi:hypothetical protein
MRKGYLPLFLVLPLVLPAACGNNSPTAPPGQVLVSNACAHDQVAVNSAYVVWLDSCAGTVDVLAKSGGAPTILAGGFDASTLVIDDQFAYVGDITNIKRVPLTGGTPSQVAAVEEDLATGLADQYTVDSANLYASNGVSLLQMPKDGSAPFQAIGTSEIGARIVADSDAIYWAMVSAIHRLSKTKGAEDQQLVVLDRPDNFLYEPLAVTSTSLFYIDNQLYAIPKAGGAPVVVDSNAGGQPGLATDTQYAYWAQGNTLVRGDETGAIDQLAFSQDGINGIAVDAASVYYADIAGQLFRADL